MPVIALWRQLPIERRKLALQLLRYAIVGFGVTSVQAAIYWLLATHSGVHSQIANFAGYVAAVLLGYIFHGRYTFADPARAGGTGAHAARGARFVIASLASLGLNALWVWSCVSFMDWPTWTPVPAMLFVTPGLVFVLNKKWVFR